MWARGTPRGLASLLLRPPLASKQGTKDLPYLERWREILKGLRKGEHFLCHKTTMKGEEDEEGNYQKAGGEMICAGSRAYQARLGIVSDAEQIMERLELLTAHNQAKRSRS
jgi:hypothetical protein